MVSVTVSGCPETLASETDMCTVSQTLTVTVLMFTSGSLADIIAYGDGLCESLRWS
jgi:hypothetical protein